MLNRTQTEWRHWMESRRSIRSFEPQADRTAMEEQDWRSYVPQFGSAQYTILTQSEFMAECKSRQLQAPYYIRLDSVEKPTKENYVEAGAFGEYLTLDLCAKGFSCCWYGMAALEKRNPAMIYIAVGKGTQPPRPFVRKPFEAICTGDSVEVHRSAIEAVRLAPSAMNWQPAYCVTCGETLYLYRRKPITEKIVPPVTRMQYIDMGIAAMHIVLSGYHRVEKVGAKRSGYEFFYAFEPNQSK